MNHWRIRFSHPNPLYSSCQIQVVVINTSIMRVRLWMECGRVVHLVRWVHQRRFDVWFFYFFLPHYSSPLRVNLNERCTQICNPIRLVEDSDREERRGKWCLCQAKLLPERGVQRGSRVHWWYQEGLTNALRMGKSRWAFRVSFVDCWLCARVCTARVVCDTVFCSENSCTT